MLEPSEHPDVSYGAKLTRFRGRVSVQDLERDVTIVTKVSCEIDRSERTLPDLTLDVVTAGDSLTNGGDGIGYSEQCGSSREHQHCTTHRIQQVPVAATGPYRASDNSARLLFVRR